MKNAGYSLLEIMIVLGLMMSASYFLKDFFLSGMKLQELVKDRNYLQLLEDELRTAIQDDQSFQHNASRDNVLKQCTKLDSVLCPRTKSIVQIQSIRGKPLTGGLAGSLKTCQEKDCPVDVEVRLSRSCAVDPSGVELKACDVAASLRFDYKIRVNGSLVRQGLLFKNLDGVTSSDENITCPTDALNRTQFAHALAYGQLQCHEIERPKFKISGVNEGRCKYGQEFLAGVIPGGKLNCKPIVWEE